MFTKNKNNLLKRHLIKQLMRIQIAEHSKIISTGCKSQIPIIIIRTQLISIENITHSIIT